MPKVPLAQKQALESGFPGEFAVSSLEGSAHLTPTVMMSDSELIVDLTVLEHEHHFLLLLGASTASWLIEAG